MGEGGGSGEGGRGSNGRKRRAMHGPPQVLLFFMASISEEMADFVDNEMHRVASVCIHAIVQYIRVLDSSGHWLNDEQAASSERFGRLFLQTYLQLRRLSMVDGSTLFNLLPKHHMFDEILINTQATRENPMRHMCLSGEDLLGKLKRIGSKTARSNMPLRLLQRYVFFLSNRMRKHQKCSGHVPERCG